jgi:hypothetical protein
MRRVPLVVFVEVPAVDDLEGGNLAAIAVRQALAGSTSAPRRMPVTIHAHLREETVPVTVTHVTDLNQAALNGYVQFTPSNRAYPEQD